MTEPAPFFTIGHSNHSLETFLDLLAPHGITAVADVRSQPFSRRQPHFNRTELASALRARAIAYVFLGDQLGGRPEQPVLYDADGRVDYEVVRAQDFFQRGLERLQSARPKFTVALMCSEEDPLDCHRGLMIAPALAERGLLSAHVRGDGTLETLAQMEQRLFAETGVGAGLLDGLFAAMVTDADRRELLAEAYRTMARKKSFRLKPGDVLGAAPEFASETDDAQAGQSFAMMQALDADSGMTIAGADARRGARYLCPQCGALVGLRAGGRRIPHFAHYSFSRCALAEPESPRHRALKWLCKTFFAPWPVVWEARVGARRVDALVDGRLVVECQSSRVALPEWHARTVNHNRLGYPVLWLWDVKRLCRKNTLDEALLLEQSERAVWVPPDIRLCHEESRGLIFVADKHQIVPCRLTRLSGAEQAAANRGSPAARFWPQALRKPTFFPGFDRNARSHFASRSHKLRLVRLGRAEETVTAGSWMARSE